MYSSDFNIQFYKFHILLRFSKSPFRGNMVLLLDIYLSLLRYLRNLSRFSCLFLSCNAFLFKTCFAKYVSKIIVFHSHSYDIFFVTDIFHNSAYLVIFFLLYNIKIYTYHFGEHSLSIRANVAYQIIFNIFKIIGIKIMISK